MNALAFLFSTARNPSLPSARRLNPVAVSDCRRGFYDYAPRPVRKGAAAVPRGVLCDATLPADWQVMPRTVLQQGL